MTTSRRWHRKSWFLTALVVILILLPFLAPWFYGQLTALPKEITITTGPEGGLYRGLSNSLADEIERRTSVKVRRVDTNGSLDNLLLLQAGKADFGLYQPGTLEVLSKHEPDVLEKAKAQILSTNVSKIPDEGELPHALNFVANLYSQPSHLIVHRDAHIESPADLEGKRVALGLKQSGGYSTSLVLLELFDLADKIDAINLNFPEFEKAFLNGSLDAAFITIGVHAPVFRRLAAAQKVQFIEIPHRQALSENYLFIYPYAIPAGLYSYLPLVVPETEIKTVAAGTQLLTRSNVNTDLVEEVTKIVLDKSFMKHHQLGELFSGGHEFALRKPDFPIHPGAQNIYDPQLRPLMSPEFVESIEGIQSFLFSAIIAVFSSFNGEKTTRA